MPPTSLTRTFGDLLTHTMDQIYQSGVFHDAVFGAYPTMAWLKDAGRIVTAAGGVKIRTDLMYQGSNGVDSYSGYDELDLSPSEGFTSAFWDWSQYHGPITIDGMTRFKNSGSSKIADLVASKSEQLAMTWADRINGDIWATGIVGDGNTGNDGKNVNSIPMLVMDDPTNGDETYTLGEIVSTGGATNTWWHNLSADGSSWNTLAEFIDGIRTLNNNLGKTAGGKPDFAITTQTIFEDYESLMEQRILYSSSDAAPGFEKIRFKQLTLMMDDDVPAGGFYILNSKYLKLFQGKGFDFKPGKFEKSYYQDAWSANAFWYGQLLTQNRRKLGVAYDIPAMTATS